MKKFDIKDVFSWSNAEEAKQYIGKDCYFADSLEKLKFQVNQDNNIKLKNVLNNYTVQSVFRDVNTDYWGLCLPVDKVKEVEKKKYIPFKAMFEFVNTVGKRTGDTIRIRAKQDNPLESIYLITGYTETHAHELKYIHLSAISYPPQELLKNYEYFGDGTWQPFGVLDES